MKIKLTTPRTRFSQHDYNQSFLRFKPLVDQLARLTGDWNPVEIVAPSNTQSVKDRFFANPNASIHFEYWSMISASQLKKVFSDLLYLKDEVKKIQVGSSYDELIKKLIIYKLDDDFATVDILKGQLLSDDQLVKQGLMFKYGEVDDSLVTQAKKQLELFQVCETEKKKAITAEKIKEIFESVIDKYHFNYQVLISDNVDAVDVRDKVGSGKPTIFIPEETHISQERLLALVAHEIEGHCLQTSNAQTVLQLGGGRLKFDEEVLYEGFALRNYLKITDLRVNSIAETSPFIGIMPIISAQAFAGTSFKEIYNLTYELVMKHKKFAKQEDLKNFAWKLLIRMFRGHLNIDNGVNYAMTKDCGYLKGWMVCGELEIQGYERELQLLSFPLALIPRILSFKFSEEDFPYQKKDLTNRLSRNEGWA